MKKLILSAIAFILAVGLYAQPQAKNLPQSVFNAFSAKYGQAKIKRWHALKDGGYVIRFKDGDHAHLAFYDQGGRWLKTETSYEYMHVLPHKLKKEWIRSGFATWHVENTTRVETPDSAYYVMLVDYINPGNLERINFQRQYYLTFTLDGTYLKKQEIKQEDD